MCGCLSHTPNWGPSLQPRHVSLLGIELETLHFSGQHSSQGSFLNFEQRRHSSPGRCDSRDSILTRWLWLYDSCWVSIQVISTLLAPVCSPGLVSLTFSCCQDLPLVFQYIPFGLVWPVTSCVYNHEV